jgi:hypothetical protein
MRARNNYNNNNNSINFELLANTIGLLHYSFVSGRDEAGRATGSCHVRTAVTAIFA